MGSSLNNGPLVSCVYFSFPAYVPQIRAYHCRFDRCDNVWGRVRIAKHHVDSYSIGLRWVTLSP